MPECRYLRKMMHGVPVVTAPAEIDVTTADQLRMVLLEAAAGGRTTVVVDMARTEFCDSCGLHTLLRASQQAVAAGGELRLVIPADRAVPRIFTVTCLDRLVPCFASLEEALAQAPAATALARPGTSPVSGSPAHQPGSPDAKVWADG
jgi:anti-sigma B factor antagonist